MLLNCGVGEDSWESLGLQGDPTSPFWRRSALGFLWGNDAKAETPVLWPPHAKSWLIGKDSDAGRDWGQEEKGTTEDEMAGWHLWTWVWVNSRSWWWTGRPGVLRFMGSQRVGHDWATELNWLNWYINIFKVWKFTLYNFLFRSLIFILFCGGGVVFTFHVLFSFTSK